MANGGVGKPTDYLYELLFDDSDHISDAYEKFRLKKASTRAQVEDDISWYKTLSKPSAKYEIAAPPVQWATVFKRAGRRFVVLPIAEPNESEIARLHDVGIAYFPTDSCGKMFGAVNGLNLTLHSNVDNLYLEQFIRAQHEDPQYTGHDWEDIYKLLQEFSIFELNKDKCPLFSQSDLAAFFILSQYDQFRIFNESIHDVIDSILLIPINFPRENILVSLTTTHRNHSFLEIYRCIEFFFSMPYAVAFRDQIKSSLTGSQIAAASQDHLNWRRKEEPALVTLLKILDIKLISGIGFEKTPLFSGLTITLTSAGWNKTGHRKVAERIYKLRNQLVHQIDRRRISRVVESDWEPLLHFLLVCLRFWLVHYREEL